MPYLLCLCSESARKFFKQCYACAYWLRSLAPTAYNNVGVDTLTNLCCPMAYTIFPVVASFHIFPIGTMQFCQFCGACLLSSIGECLRVRRPIGCQADEVFARLTYWQALLALLRLLIPTHLPKSPTTLSGLDTALGYLIQHASVDYQQAHLISNEGSLHGGCSKRN